MYIMVVIQKSINADTLCKSCRCVGEATALPEDARSYVIDDVEAHLQVAYRYEATKGKATCCHNMRAPARVQRVAMATWLRPFAMMLQPLHHAGSAQSQEYGADYLAASLSDDAPASTPCGLRPGR